MFMISDYISSIISITKDFLSKDYFEIREYNT